MGGIRIGEGDFDGDFLCMGVGLVDHAVGGRLG